MSTNVLTGLLVGMHFRPPAKLILECLPAGAKLSLRAEQDNPYDENAVAVEVEFGATAPSQRARLESELPNYGSSIEELSEAAERGEMIHLGYLAKRGNKSLDKIPGLSSNEVFLQAQSMIAWRECDVRLGFGPSGEALVILDAPA